MYTLKIVNNFTLPIKTVKGQIINERGGMATIKNLGDFYVEVLTMGTLVFNDLGSKKIPGYSIPNETWGVLIRYCNTEVYYRYEGGGEIEVTIDVYGSSSITTSNGTMVSIKLEELIIN